MEGQEWGIIGAEVGSSVARRRRPRFLLPLLAWFMVRWPMSNTVALDNQGDMSR